MMECASAQEKQLMSAHEAEISMRNRAAAECAYVSPVECELLKWLENRIRELPLLTAYAKRPQEEEAREIAKLRAQLKHRVHMLADVNIGITELRRLLAAAIARAEAAERNESVALAELKEYKKLTAERSAIYPTEAEAARAWNAPALLAKAEAENARLREALRALVDADGEGGVFGEPGWSDREAALWKAARAALGDTP